MFPWLVQGTTTRGEADQALDFGVFSDGSAGETVVRHWDDLLATTGMKRVVHARQVHGREVTVHGAGPEGLGLVEECDGHVTGEPAVLLAVTTADCVPVFVVDARRRVVGLVHAGWRGTAAGVVEQALALLTGDLGSSLQDLHIHLGPAICGSCYEVGPEVFEALRQTVPPRPTPIDLRVVLAGRAARSGVPTAQLSVSEHCTRCTGSGLFSHRGGDRARQVGFLGIRG